MNFEERAKYGCSIFLSLIVLTTLSIFFFYRTKDLRIAIIAFILMAFFSAYFFKDSFMNFFKGKKVILKGHVTWKWEYCENVYDARFLNSDKKVWHYRVYLGSNQIDVSESKFKTINQGDLLLIEKPKEGTGFYKIEILEKAEKD